MGSYNLDMLEEIRVAHRTLRTGGEKSPGTSEGTREEMMGSETKLDPSRRESTL
jgi:hypothetical protein